ncbi:MAG: hypothetical protein RIK87_16185 [Fuerstiella sp.]
MHLVGQRHFLQNASVFATRSASEELNVTHFLAGASGYYRQKTNAVQSGRQKNLHGKIMSKQLEGFMNFGHAWRANGPQFVIWFPPGTIPRIDLSHEKGTL